MTDPMCAHYRGPDDFCTNEVPHDGDLCHDHLPPDLEDFYFEVWREENA